MIQYKRTSTEDIVCSERRKERGRETRAGAEYWDQRFKYEITGIGCLYLTKWRQRFRKLGIDRILWLGGISDDAEDPTAQKQSFSKCGCTDVFAWLRDNGGRDFYPSEAW